MERDTPPIEHNEALKGHRMSPLERARAIEGMQQGMLLAELTLKACDFVRNVFKPNARAKVQSAAGGHA
ncbi:MAG: hypothetical protein ABI981_01735 [Betaproteobacteria bacterium]